MTHLAQIESVVRSLVGNPSIIIMDYLEGQARRDHRRAYIGVLAELRHQTFKIWLATSPPAKSNITISNYSDWFYIKSIFDIFTGDELVGHRYKWDIDPAHRNKCKFVLPPFRPLNNLFDEEILEDIVAKNYKLYHVIPKSMAT